MRLSLVTKFGGFVFCVVLVTGITVGLGVHIGSNRVLVKQAMEDLGDAAEIGSTQFSAPIAAFSNDVKFLGKTPPIKGIIRAVENGGIDPMSGSTTDEWSERLAVVFTAFLGAKPNYFQIRYIGIAHNGREITRVERFKNRVVRVTGDQLQSKANRPYFKAARTLKPGQVYLSDISLNREQGKVSTPHVRTIRAAAPIYSNQAEVFGIVIVNMDIGPMLDRLEETARGKHDIYVTNAAGDYLIHPDPSKTFGFDLETPHRIREDYPVLGSILQHMPEKTRQIIYEDDVVASARKVAFDPLSQEQYIEILMIASEEDLLAGAVTVRNQSALLAFVLIIAATAFALFFAYLLVRPVVQITRATQMLSEQEDVDISRVTLPNQSPDEIGILARSFQHMVTRLQQRDAALKDRGVELEASEAKIRTILETAPDGIITIDEHGIVESFNTSAGQIFGYAQENVIGKDVSLIVVLPDGVNTKDFLSHYVPTEASDLPVFRREIEGRRNNDTRFPMDISISPAQVSSRLLFTLVVRDVTDRKQAERRVLHTEKLAAVGKLVASIAHEFNNPIYGIRNALEQTLEHSTVPTNHQTTLQLAISECNRIANLVRELQEFNCPTTGKVTGMNLHQAIENTLHLIQTRFQSRGIKVITQFSADMPEIEAVSDQVRQVILNLLQNAEDAIAESGGTVTVSTAVIGTMAEFTVTDTGAGIAEEHLGKIFDPFFTTKGQVKGTGLGLSTSYNIVKQHRGDLTVESTPGQGAAFRVILPITQGVTT